MAIRVRFDLSGGKDRYSNSHPCVNPLPISSTTYGPHTPLITPTTISAREDIRGDAKIGVTRSSNTLQTVTRWRRLQYERGFRRKESGSYYGGLKTSTNYAHDYLPRLTLLESTLPEPTSPCSSSLNVHSAVSRSLFVFRLESCTPCSSPRSTPPATPNRDEQTTGIGRSGSSETRSESSSVNYLFDFPTAD